ncbi:MAG: TonB-dependent receptor [Vicinamibacterales bacterium]|nr:TonB-dependent receptor [Vicinamibacterales bacterium]
MRRLWIAGLCLALSVTAAFAQSNRGTITGTVTDAGGGVVPGANVVAEDPQSGTKYETVTTPTGSYTIVQVPVGVYNLSVELQGFGKFRQEGIRIFTAQTARIDAKLEVGNLSEEVRVVADASMLKTENAEISSSITSENLNELPLNFGARGNFAAAAIRNPYTFVNLVPGGSISSYSSIKLNGAPLNTYQIRVEGMEANNNRLVIRVDQVQPSVESLEEMTVHTSNFAAEYGSVAGGIFNLTAKSGTNQFRGSMFDYFVNEAFGAGIPYTNDGNGELLKPRNRRNNWGGSLGGPVILPKYDGHNKTFFFYSFEQFRQIETRAGLLSTVPTDRMRNGDFGEALTGRVLATDPLGRPIMENAIYDPRTTRTAPNGQIVRDPFPNNVIPQELIDPVARKIQAYIPTATRPGFINNWDQSFPADTVKSISTVKADHNFTSAGGKLSAYVSRYWGPHYNGSDGLPIPITAVRRIPTSTWTTRVSYDWTLSPTTLLDIRGGYVRHYNPDGPLPEVRDFDPVKELGLVGALNGNGFPIISNSLFAATGGGLNQQIAVGGSIPATRKPAIQGSLTHARNSHTYKFGFEWRDDQLTGSPIIAGANYGFNAQQSGLPSTNGQNLSGGSVGLPYASFLLGLVNTASVANPPDPQWRKPTAAGYAQDTWKITGNLTLDYGLRWDYQGYPYEDQDRRSMFDPNVANPAAGNLTGATTYEGSGTGACNCRFVKTDPKAIGPRVGASYQMNQKTVIRGGYAITYAQTNGGESAGGGTLGAGGWSTLNYSSAAFGDPANILKNGLIYNRDDLFKVTNNPGIRPSLGQIDNPSQWIHPDAGRMPKMQQWSISVQREFLKDFVGEVAYVGNRGTGFLANSLSSLNAISEERLRSFGLDLHNTADQALLRSRLDSATAAARGFNKAPYASYSLANTVAQSLRPYAQFGTFNSIGVPLGMSWYDSMQVKVNKRYGHGLNFTYTFTWQKEYNNFSGSQYDIFQSPESQKSISSLSEPLVSVLAFNYMVPTIEGNGFVKAIASNWTIGGMVRYASGLPIPVPASTNNQTTLTFQTTRFNRVPGEPLYLKDLNGKIDPNADFVLNPKAWVDAPQGEYSTSPAYYDDFRYQRRPDEQFSFGRVFPMKGTTSLSIRMEFFNAFNRTQMNNPSATNPLQTQLRNAQGVPISGYGRIDTGSVYGPPRSGQIVARVSF